MRLSVGLLLLLGLLVLFFLVLVSPFSLRIIVIRSSSCAGVTPCVALYALRSLDRKRFRGLKISSLSSTARE